MLKICKWLLHCVCYFILVLNYVDRKKVHAKFVERMMIFWAVKPAIILIIPIACFLLWEVPSRASGSALHVYVSLTLLIISKDDGWDLSLIILLCWWQVGYLNELEKVLDCELRPCVVNDSDASKLGSTQALTKHYLVKWKGLSYLHCTW